MMRLIDADALAFDVLGLTIVSPEVMNYANAVTAAIAKAPTIEAEPVRHGHWRKILVPKKWNGPVVRCSECNFGGYTGSKYCSDCGAKMDLEG